MRANRYLYLGLTLWISATIVSLALSLLSHTA